MTNWMSLGKESFRQDYVEAFGVSTRYLMVGKGPIVVFLHGTAGTLEAHTSVIPYLSAKYTLIFYDMPGRGWSEKPNIPYTVEYLSEHLNAFIQALQLERVHLVGQSLGAWVAAWTAAKYDRIVDRLVLNNPGNVKNRQAQLEWLRSSNKEIEEKPSLAAIRRRLEYLFYKKECVSDEMVHIRYLSQLLPGASQAMQNISVMQDPNVRALYNWSETWCHHIKAPTLWIWSRHNPLATYEDMLDVASYIKGSQFVIIEDSGEFPQIEATASFSQVIHSFLGEVGRAAGNR